MGWSQKQLVGSQRRLGRGLVLKLRNQGYKEADLRRLTLKFFKDRQEILGKYNIANANIFLTSIVH